MAADGLREVEVISPCFLWTHGLKSLMSVWVHLLFVLSSHILCQVVKGSSFIRPFPEFLCLMYWSLLYFAVMSRGATPVITAKTSPDTVQYADAVFTHICF